MASLLLPPSPNWFLSGAVSGDPVSKRFATASFKNIIIYENGERTNMWSPSKQIYYNLGKVSGVSFYPFRERGTFNDQVAAVGDNGSLLLIDAITGSYIAQRKVKNAIFKSVDWAVIDNDECIVSAGSLDERGIITLWFPKCNAVRSYTHVESEISIISVVPKVLSEAIVATEKQILHINLKNGSICEDNGKKRIFKGHKDEIYDLKWHTGDKIPFSCNEYDPDEELSSPRFFATSDLAMNIFIWDFMKGERVIQSDMAGQGIRKTAVKGKDLAKHHIALAWIENSLYTGSFKGEVCKWELKERHSECEKLYHPHNRVVYNLINFGSTLISSSQDRELVGYCTEDNKITFKQATIGVRPCSLAFNPMDSGRVAIGLVDGSIKVLLLEGTKILKSRTIHQKLKSRIMALAYHPAEEKKELLLVGTSQGEVMIINTDTTKIDSFSSHHGKDVYKVEWGPPIRDHGFNDEYVVYSFGDKNIYARLPSKVNKNPLDIRSILPGMLSAHNCSCVEFSFSPDYKYLAIGFSEGIIQIFDFEKRQLFYQVDVMRKAVQHILWKPFNIEKKEYVIAVGTAENNVHIFKFQVNIDEDKEKPIYITKQDIVLRGHTSRVIWLSWSPHKDDLLTSASYDHTITVWNVKDCKPVCCYGGHSQRVFRAEFSLTSKDLIFSFAEENTLHAWKPSAVTTKTPKEVNENAKEITAAIDTPHMNGTGKDSRSPSPDIPKKKVEKAANVKAKKSMYPVFHNSVYTKKRTFVQICLLVMLKEARNKKLLEQGDIKAKKNLCRNEVLNEICENYNDFMPDDEPMLYSEVSVFLDFFGSMCEFDNAILREIKFHEDNDNTFSRDILHCWRGSTDEHIRSSALQNKLTPFLLSLTAKSTNKLYHFAAESYISQLIDEGEIVTASAYMLLIKEPEHTVDFLLKHKLYKEAYTVARNTNAFENSIIEKVVYEWCASAIRDSHIEIACALYLSIGKFEPAARALGRRQDPLSHTICSKLYSFADLHEQSENELFIAVNDYVKKQQFEKCEMLMNKDDDDDNKLKWYEAIIRSYKMVLKMSDRVVPPFTGNLKMAENYVECSVIPCIMHTYQQASIDILDEYYLENIKKFFRLSDFLSSQAKTEFYLLSIAAATAIFSHASSKFQTWKSSIENIFRIIVQLDNQEHAYRAARLFIGKVYNPETSILSPDPEDFYAKEFAAILPYTELNYIVKLLESYDEKLTNRETKDYADNLVKQIKDIDRREIFDSSAEFYKKIDNLIEKYKCVS